MSSSSCCSLGLGHWKTWSHLGVTGAWQVISQQLTLEDKSSELNNTGIWPCHNWTFSSSMKQLGRLQWDWTHPQSLILSFSSLGDIENPFNNGQCLPMCWSDLITDYDNKDYTLYNLYYLLLRVNVNQLTCKRTDCRIMCELNWIYYKTNWPNSSEKVGSSKWHLQLWNWVHVNGSHTDLYFIFNFEP